MRFFGNFLEIPREQAWTVWRALTPGKDVLEPGERCAGATRRRAGGDWADHDGTFGAATAERARGDSRCRGTSRAAIAILSHSALAVRTGIRRKSTADVRNVSHQMTRLLPNAGINRR
jgi:hypothetical protein